ncbi:MAG TPA: glycosyltransferase [Candidatus Elarobacter sp.]
MKLLIAIPTGGTPARPFLDALAALELPDAVTEAGRLVWTGNFVPAQREMIARDAVNAGADYLAMIDDDIVLPPDALARLIDVLETDDQVAVAGALYYSRDGARPMAVARWSSADTTTAAIPAFGGSAVADVDGVGFGCVVVRVAALRALPQPYFSSHLYVDVTARIVRQCDEDYLLCERLRAAGWRIALHAGVRAGHFDRGTETSVPQAWESDAQTDQVRMIVRTGEGTSLVPFDDRAPRVVERHEAFAATLLIVGEDGRS